MNRTMLGSVVALACCVASPFAQQQPAPKAEPAHNVFVVTGCLMAGANATTTFKLTDATPIGQARAAAAEPGAVGTSGEKASYELRPVSGVGAQGLDADALKAHLGHRVEAVIRPIESPAPAVTATAGAVGAVKPIEPAPERYTVTTMKRAVGRCS